MATTRTKTNGPGGLKWPTIVAFLALFIPLVYQVAQVQILDARFADHIEGATRITTEIKAVAISHDGRIRDNSDRVARLESE